MWTERGPPSAGWFKLSEFGFRVHLLVRYHYVVLVLQVVKSPPRTSGSAPLRRAEIDLFQLHQKKRAHRIKKKKGIENVDSHLGFKSRVKAPGSVGAVLFLLLKYSLIKVSMVSKLQSQRDCLVCEGGALHRSPSGLLDALP
jgi:hypothetical protein